MSPEADGRVFHTLDALRGVAAIGVVIYHMQAAFAPLATPGGYLAVDLFFIMSGVVLSHAYEVRFHAGMRTLDFMRARLIRLYPLYLLGTVFGIGVTVASLFGHNVNGWDGPGLVQAAALGVLLLPTPFWRPFDPLFPLNIPSWSLLLELIVNLLFVLFWPWLSRRRLLVVASLGAAAIALATFQHGNLDQGYIAATFPVGLARTIFGFCVGILIARQVPGQPRRESNLAFVALVSVGLIAIVGWPLGQLRILWDIVCVVAVFPLLVYWGTRVDPGPLLRRWATFLGVTSYAVYVLHSPLSSVLNSASHYLAGDRGLAAGAPWVGFAVLIVLLAGCWLVDRYYDTPVRRLLGRIVPKYTG